MLEGIVDFVRKIERLKKVERSGWKSWVGIENPESVAEHSFASAVLAMCIADLKGLDAQKLVLMLLLHDIHEEIIGDYDYFAKKRIEENELKKLEEEAIRKILEGLPEKLAENYLAIWTEFQEQKTIEAKIAKEIDHLEMIFQALEYENEGYNKDKLSVFWENAEEKFKDEDLKQIFQLLKKRRNLNA